MAVKTIIRAKGGTAEREVRIADIVIHDVRAFPLFLTVPETRFHKEARHENPFDGAIFSPVIFQLRTMTIILAFSAVRSVPEFPKMKQESTHPVILHLAG
jgi:hypothetical protein